MMLSDSSTDARPQLVGCDEAAQTLFRQRYAPIRAFLHHHLAISDAWGEILSPEVRETLHARFRAFEQHVIQSRLGHLERMTADHLRYRHDYLTPLARDLGLFARVRQALIAQCFQHGLFDRHIPDQHRLTYSDPPEDEPRATADEQREIVVQCLRHGLFDRHIPDRHRLTRPDPAEMIPQVMAAYDPTHSEAHQVERFLTAGICRSEPTARRVTRALALAPQMLAAYTPTRTDKAQAAAFQDTGICGDILIARAIAGFLAVEAQRAISHARSFILAAIAHGWIGVLDGANYPYTRPLWLLQAQTDLITRLTAAPLSVLGRLRADLIALQRVLHPFHVTWKENRQPRRHQKLWLESLLHLPPDAPLRAFYRDRLTEEMQQTVVRQLSQERGCEASEAAQLFTTFHQGGIPGLIDWRCQVAPQTAQHVLVQQRLAQAVDRQLAALQPRHRQEIIRLVEAVAAACQETGVQLPIARLLHDDPSSRYRRSLGRRLRLGMGALVQHRMRRRTRRRMVLGQRRRRQRTDDGATPGTSPEDRLVTAFTRSAALSPDDHHQEARTRLRQFITSGGIGLLPKAQWNDLLDERVARALAFYKLGHPAGTTGWGDVLHATQAYAVALGLVPPSSHLAHVVFSTIRKPTRWHGGDGPAVRQVRQRKTLMLDAPRLHETWLVMPVTKRLHLSIVDAAGRQVSTTCRALLVFDTAIERPVGYWLSTTAPNSREVGLVLYQAIWHPGALSWPLRGVPDVTQIPEMLVTDGTHDLEQAAAWMHNSIESITRRKMDYALSTRMPYAAKLLDTLAEHAPDYIRWKTGREAVTIQEAMDALRTWLHVDTITRTDPHAQGYPVADCFPNHNAPDVPARIADYGVALPGHHLPAAGWLLPVAEHAATTVRDAVEYRGITYTDAGFRSEPGRNLAVRLFPHWYRDMEQGIFVEAAAGELRYLVRQD